MREAAIEAKGGPSRLMRKGRLPAAKLEAPNRPLRPVRARIEKIFGTWKRGSPFRLMCRVGLSQARRQVHPAAIAYHVTRSCRLQTA